MFRVLLFRYTVIALLEATCTRPHTHTYTPHSYYLLILVFAAITSYSINVFCMLLHHMTRHIPSPPPYTPHAILPTCWILHAPKHSRHLCFVCGLNFGLTISRPFTTLCIPHTFPNMQTPYPSYYLLITCVMSDDFRVVPPNLLILASCQDTCSTTVLGRLLLFWRCSFIPYQFRKHVWICHLIFACTYDWQLLIYMIIERYESMFLVYPYNTSHVTSEWPMFTVDWGFKRATRHDSSHANHTYTASSK